jgi:hypothetical protein
MKLRRLNMLGESRASVGVAWALGALVAAALAGGAGCGGGGVTEQSGSGGFGVGGSTGEGGAGGGGGTGGMGGASAAAGGGGSSQPTGGATGTYTVTDPGDAQTPPMGPGNEMAWLDGGAYKKWRCQGGTHAPVAPSIHGTSKICSNTLASGAGAGEYPVGAASVIETYDNTGTVRGRSVSRHAAAGTGPETWYWYQDLQGVFFGDGLGLSGCSSCHATAGINGTGHDYVFVQVK